MYVVTNPEIFDVIVSVSGVVTGDKLAALVGLGVVVFEAIVLWIEDEGDGLVDWGFDDANEELIQEST